MTPEKFTKIVKDVLSKTQHKLPKAVEVGDFLIESFLSTRVYRVLSVNEMLSITSPEMPRLMARPIILQKVGFTNRDGSFVAKSAKPFVHLYTFASYYHKPSNRFLKKHKLYKTGNL